MRKAFFAVVLVAASFAGGAAINGNGPALAWARSMLTDQARGPGRTRAATPTRPAGAPAPEPEPMVDPADALSVIPSAPAPALVLDAPRLEPPPPPRGKRPKADAALTTARDGPREAGADADARAPEPLDPAALGLAPPASKESPAPPEVDRPADHAGGDRPAPNRVDLMRRMKALGVARYWVEGEPGGPSRFRCVIPTAGGRAVGQHFEAEGDDDLQAAEAALRRVALWKATEP